MSKRQKRDREPVTPDLEDIFADDPQDATEIMAPPHVVGAPPINVEHEAIIPLGGTLAPDVEVVVVSETVPPHGRAARAVANIKAGRDVAGKPSSVHLEDALMHWGMEAADVLGWREVPEVELVLVTRGGTKLRWPDDMARTLTDAEKGRAKPPDATRSIFTKEPRR